MNRFFEKEFYLRTSDFDRRMELFPSAVLITVNVRLNFQIAWKSL